MIQNTFWKQQVSIKAAVKRKPTTISSVFKSCYNDGLSFWESSIVGFEIWGSSIFFFLFLWLGIFHHGSAELGRLECKWVHEGVWVSKSDYLACLQWLSSINQAIIIGEPLEGAWIYYSCRGKPTTVEMNVWRRTSAGNTGVEYLDYVPWDSRCRISALRDAYISVWATALWKGKIENSNSNMGLASLGHMISRYSNLQKEK
jgi:hypothetical protein